MDYAALIQGVGDKISRVGVLGATKGYGYTLLVQLRNIPHMVLRTVCSRHPDECEAVLAEIGYDPARFAVCASEEEVKAAPEDAIIIVADYKLMMVSGITSLIEATGNTIVSPDAAVRAFENGINVYMVSKETDSVCGPIFNRMAHEKGLVYTLVNGDQPRNLLDLISWARVLGLEIICAGKSSEYDFVWDSETGDFLYNDGTHEKETCEGLRPYWHYEGPETLEGRREVLKKYCDPISADLCEMNLVSNVSGLTPAAPSLHYPVARASELADIFIPKEDGGILDHTGVVDVFYCFRDAREASFAGGEFIVIRCENEKMWEMLIGKGHVVSRNKKYCCIYYPFHLMGLESPISLLMGDLKGIGTHPECRQVSVLTGVAVRDLPAGTVLKVEGHHHEILGTTPQLLRCSEAADAAPYYLLNGTTLLRDVKCGSRITMDDVDLSGLKIFELYREGLAL